MTDEQIADCLYKRHRSYVEHENHLVNFRVGWLVAIEAAAIVGFGWTLHAASEKIQTPFLHSFTLYAYLRCLLLHWH